MTLYEAFGAVTEGAIIQTVDGSAENNQEIILFSVSKSRVVQWGRSFWTGLLIQTQLVGGGSLRSSRNLNTEKKAKHT